MSQLTVQLVTWNGAKYLPFLFASLKHQTFTDWDIIVVDNNSTDETVHILENELQSLVQKSELIISTTNQGFAGGHNLAFTKSASRFVVLLNQDLYLAADCFEKLLAALKERPQAAVCTPRLMRWDFVRSATAGAEHGFTTTIDSLGLRVLKNRRVVEWGAGETWGPHQKSGTVEVFGVSGALPLFRRSCLEAVLLPAGTVFDGLYTMYKEDVDLAFRLRLAGFEAYSVMNAVAYHDRTAAHGAKLGDAAAVRGKRLQSDFVAYHSYKNHLATLYKNAAWEGSTLDFLALLWYEIKKFGYFLFFKPSILKGLLELWKHRQDFKQAQKVIQAYKKITALELRKWWT